MKYILFLILMSHDGSFELREVNTYTAMDDCFNGRSSTIEMIGRPIISYQAVCVRTPK